MLQAQIISMLMALNGVGVSPQGAVMRAAQGYISHGMAGAQQAFVEAGYYPFAWGLVADEREANDAGLSQCAPLPQASKLLCARLIARVADQSPVHLRVEAAPGFALMHAHVVDASGRVEKLMPDAVGIFDLPVHPQPHAVGISLRGPLGPETGVYVELDRRSAPRDPCGSENDLSDLLHTINGVRAEIGRRPLSFRRAPKGYATQRGNELSIRFGHSPLGLRKTLKRHQLRLRFAAEVVAEDPSLSAICRGWLRSPSHRAALLDARRDGIAFVQRGERLTALLWAKR